MSRIDTLGYPARWGRVCTDLTLGRVDPFAERVLKRAQVLKSALILEKRNFFVPSYRPPTAEQIRTGDPPYMVGVFILQLFLARPVT
jgi:hypothetical protein